MHENCGNEVWVRWWEGIAEWRVFDSWNARGSILFLKLFHSPIFILSPSVRATRKQYKEICHVRVFAPCEGMNIYIVTRYTSPILPARLSVVRAIGPINRSNDVLVRTCHEKNKSETCFAFFLTAVMAVLSNLWLRRLLLQGRKPKRRKQNNLYNIFVWNQWRERRLLLRFFSSSTAMFIIFTTIKETIKCIIYCIYIFNLIK
jgi:hypothetical protein